MPHRNVNPESLNAQAIATSYGVAAATVAGNTLMISGQAPVDRDINVIGDTFEEQTRVVFESFTVVLHEAGFRWDDLVKINAYVSLEDTEALGIYCGILKEYLARYSSRDSVAHIYVVVKALALPGVMIEIDGMAIKAGD